MHHHLDFDCQENEILCSNYPNCRDRFKKRELESHLRSECQFAQITCSKCTLSFLRSDISTHDCLLALVRHVKLQDQKLKQERDRCSEMEVDMKRLQDLVRERDRRIMELDGNIQVDHLSQLVGGNIHN